jgi:hypothetical protein
MPTSKGITTIPNTAAMAGPAQMTQIATDVDARLPASVAKATDLSTLPDKWPGRLQTVDEDGVTYVYTGSTNGWQALAAPVQSGTITPATNVVVDSRSYLKRRGKQVTMLLAVGRTSGVFSTNQDLATIPAAFRPVTGTIGVMGVYTTGAAPGTCSVYVRTDGGIAIAGYSTVNGATSMVVVVSYEI